MGENQRENTNNNNSNASSNMNKTHSAKQQQPVEASNEGPVKKKKKYETKHLNEFEKQTRDEERTAQSEANERVRQYEDWLIVEMKFKIFLLTFRKKSEDAMVNSALAAKWAQREKQFPVAEKVKVASHLTADSFVLISSSARLRRSRQFSKSCRNTRMGTNRAVCLLNNNNNLRRFFIDSVEPKKRDDFEAIAKQVREKYKEMKKQQHVSAVRSKMDSWSILKKIFGC